MAMERLRGFGRRFRLPWRSAGRIRRDVDDEIAFHLTEKVEALRREGLSRDEARDEALAQFGDLESARERLIADDRRGERRSARFLLVDSLMRDMRFAWRSLLHTPGFTITVVLTLALCIGANSAVFSAIDAVLLKPLSFPQPDRLVLVTQTEAGSAEDGIAPVRLEDWQEGNGTFESITGYSVEDASDTTGEFPERVRRAEVGPRFLETFGVVPANGRDFTSEEYRPGGPRAMLISDGYWRNRLGADPNAVGRTLQINDTSYTVVGVMPPSFTFPGVGIDLWNPDWSPSAVPAGSQRFLAWYTGIGRLKPGVTIDEARADLAVVQGRLAAEFPQSDDGVTPNVEPLKQVVIGPASTALWALYGAVTVLLLIACMNIASLLLARAARREQEIAIRYSLGASRRAVITQLLAESTVLSAAGALLGLFVAAFGVAAFRAFGAELPRAADIAIDARLAAYIASATVAVAALCGFFPALRTSGQAPARHSRAHVAARHFNQWLLVGAQVTLSVALLAGAGLLLRSFDALMRVDAGFDPSRVLTFRISADWAESSDYDGVIQRLNATIDELGSVPGVETVATAALLPGIPGEYGVEVEVADGGGASDEHLLVEQRVVSPEYFATMRIPLLEGRLCSRPVTAAGNGVEAMVNQIFVEQYFPNRPEIGLDLSDSSGTPMRIAGIVGDARERGLNRQPAAAVYSCFSAPTVFPWFLVRTTDDPNAVAASIRARVREIEPLRAVYELEPLEVRIGNAYLQNRLVTALLTTFAAAALALVCLGVYGTLSYVVNLRRREVGLRIALGAPRGNIVFQFLKHVLAIAGFACVAGLAVSLGLARTLSGLLYDVTPTDPGTFSAAIGLVVLVAACAALFPAMRAARLEPMHALREE